MLFVIREDSVGHRDATAPLHGRSALVSRWFQIDADLTETKTAVDVGSHSVSFPSVVTADRRSVSGHSVIASDRLSVSGLAADRQSR